MEDKSPQNLGEEITMDEHGLLNVPNYPLISVVASDADVWKPACDTLNAAIEKAYAGHKKIVWQVLSSDEEAESQSCVGFHLESTTTNTLSQLYSGVLLMKQIEWHEAAGLLQESLDAVLQKKIIPQGSELYCEYEHVNAADFCETVIDDMNDEIDFDVDAAQYDALAAKFKEEFESATDNTVEIAKKAMEKARKKLTEAGQFTEEKGEKLKEFLENDLSRVSQEMKKGAKEKLNPSRLGTGALASISKLLHKTGVVLSNFADKADASLACKSGEITSAGKLVCKACGHKMNFKKTGRIPPCPKCHKTEFTKGY